MSLEWKVENGEWRTLAQQREAAQRLLSRMVGEGILVEHNGKGAPYLPQRPDLQVSISHCRTAVAVAVSTCGPVGIDVECRRKVGDSLMQRVCSPAEYAGLQASADTILDFLRLWTRKEAVLKLRGTGIQGFGSMVHALEDKNIIVEELPCGIPDTVAALATVRDE